MRTNHDMKLQNLVQIYVLSHAEEDWQAVLDHAGSLRKEREDGYQRATVRRRAEIEMLTDFNKRYEDALQQIVDSEDQTMSYPDDLYFRAVAIARKALDP